MKETRMPPAKSANLAANSGNTIYGASVIGSTGKTFKQIWIRMQQILSKKMHFKMLSAKWRPSCLGLNVLSYRDEQSKRQKAFAFS